MTNVSLETGKAKGEVFDCNGQSEKNEPLERELRVGEGWLYQCQSCDHQVTLDVAFPEKCPRCGAGGCWGHLTTPGEDTDNKNDEVMMEWGIKIPQRILSQENNAVVCTGRQNNSIFQQTWARGPGRPCQPVPEDLIKEMDHQGLSSRKIAADLAARGFNLSYKSVQRYLRRQKQGSFL